MFIISVILHTVPAETILTLVTSHLLATSILGDKHVTVRARFSFRYDFQVLFECAKPSRNINYLLIETIFCLQRIRPRSLTLSTAKLILAVNLIVPI